MFLAGNARPTDVGFANGKPFFECLGSGLGAALYPLGEEIKSGRVHRLLGFMRRAYRYRRQKFVLALDRPACDALVRGPTNESRSSHAFSDPESKIEYHPPFRFSANIANFNSGGTLSLLPLDAANALRNPSPFVSQSCESTARENCPSTSTAHFRRIFGC